jgi:signal transduction histidine kinase
MIRSRWSDAHTFAVFAVLHAVAVLLGRATVLPGQEVSLVWPAAGVAVLWLMWTRRPVAVLVTLALEQVVLMLATGASPVLALTATLAALLQTWLVVAVLRRWVPGALGTGGGASIHSLPVLARGTASVALGCAAGALVGCVALLLDSGSFTWVDAAQWFGRQLCGLMIVASVGHLTWERLTQPHRRPAAGAPELALLWATSALAYTVVFTHELPVAFLVIPLSVWCAVRFSTYAAAVHAATSGAVAVVVTMFGVGPFSLIDEAAVAALLTQAFTLVLLMTALVVGSVRDQREDVVGQLVRSEATAAARADLLTAMNHAMEEGLALVDASGTVVQANDSARRLLASTSARGATSTSAYELLRPDGSPLPSSEHPSRRALAEGETAPTDIVVPLEDGTRRVLSVRATRLPLGFEPGSGPVALLVYRDVTAERADSRRLAEFAEVTAHDLRSPLTTVRGWASMASSELAGDDPSVPRAHDLVAKALVGVTRLGGLIDEMLDHALAEGAELRPEPLGLAGPDGLVQDLGDLLAVPHLTVHADGDHTVLGDERAIRQVFANLLSNAVKYADPHRPLAVDVRILPRGSRIRVEVSDNGRGIAEEDQETVFDRFSRSGSATSVVGTGIGLAVCRLVVERHGGTISCRSGPDGVGATFAFDLPARVDG